MYRNEEPVTGETDFLPLIWGREAAAYVDKYKDSPFFMYVAFNQPHGPIEATQEYEDKFSHIANEEDRTFAALMSGLDDAVGMILDAVKRNGLDEKTIIIFSNDNGRPRGANFRNGPYTGGKHDYTEGGVRVPTFCRWKGHLQPGTVYPHPITSLDFLPTALALAGVSPPEEKVYDGVDIIPYIKGEKSGVPHDALVWFRQARHDKQEADQLCALRCGDWKVVKFEDRIGEEEVLNWYLIHLPTNPGEEKEDNKNDEHPELLEQLAAAAELAEEQILADEPLNLDLPDISTRVEKPKYGKPRSFSIRHFDKRNSHGFHFHLGFDADVRMDIINVQGKKVQTLVNARIARGYYSFSWDGKNSGGKRCAPGTYIARVSGAGYQSHSSFLIK